MEITSVSNHYHTFRYVCTTDGTYRRILDEKDQHPTWEIHGPNTFIWVSLKRDASAEMEAAYVRYEKEKEIESIKHISKQYVVDVNTINSYGSNITMKTSNIKAADFDLRDFTFVRKFSESRWRLLVGFEHSSIDDVINYALQDAYLKYIDEVRIHDVIEGFDDKLWYVLVSMGSVTMWYVRQACYGDNGVWFPLQKDDTLFPENKLELQYQEFIRAGEEV